MRWIGVPKWQQTLSPDNCPSKNGRHEREDVTNALDEQFLSQRGHDKSHHGNFQDERVKQNVQVSVDDEHVYAKDEESTASAQPNGRLPDEDLGPNVDDRGVPDFTLLHDSSGNEAESQEIYCSDKIPKRYNSLLQYLLKFNVELFTTDGSLVPRTHSIWTRASNFTGKSMKPVSIFLMVQKNRYDFLHILSKEAGMNYSFDSHDSFSSGEVGNTSHETDITDDESELHEDHFTIKLSYREYLDILPGEEATSKSDRKRKYISLKAGAWTSVLYREIYKSTAGPCVWCFKKSRIARNTDYGGFYLIISAYCKDCSAKMEGRTRSRPEENMPLIIECSIEPPKLKRSQHSSKRPLNGEERKVVGEKLETNIACNLRRSQIRTSCKYGDFLPANVPSVEVLRKAKQEHIDKKLNITVKHPILSLITLKNTEPHAGSIHDISIDPVMILYWSPEQLHAYRKCFRNKSLIFQLSVDATGSIVRKVDKTGDKIMSNDIFLYEIVLHCDLFTIPIAQMLSERQDIFSITHFFQQWLTHGAPHPKEIVMDMSAAIMGAACRSFCDGMTTRKYKDTCLQILDGTLTQSDLPRCYVRNDIAHLVHLVSNWKSLKDDKQSLKEFYVRCVKSLVFCDDFEDFKIFAKHVLTVCSCDTAGSIQIADEKIMSPAKAARKWLESRFKGHEGITIPVIEDTYNEFYECDVDSPDSIPVLMPESEQDARRSEPSLIKVFIEKLVDEADQLNETKGGKPNHYESAAFKKDFMRILQSFPLWTAVMKPFFNSPHARASSSAVEGDFADVKRRIMANALFARRADKFVATHLNAILSIMIEANEKVTRRDEQPSSDTDVDEPDSSANEMEDGMEKCVEEEYLTEGNFDKEVGELLELDACLELNEERMTTPHNLGESEEDSGDSVLTIDAIENWRGKAKPHINRLSSSKRKSETGSKEKSKFRPSKYQLPDVEVERKLKASRKQRRYSRKLLLPNGNISGLIKVGTVHYKVANTCPFDSLASCLITSIIDEEKYGEYIQTLEGQFPKFCTKLTTTGVTRDTMKERLNILIDICPQDVTVGDLIVVEGGGNVEDFADRLLVGDAAASKTEIKDCKKCDATLKSSKAVVPVGLQATCKNGFGSFPQDVTDYFKLTTKTCATCQGAVTVRTTPGVHLLFSVEYFSNYQNALENNRSTRCPLTDIPETLIIHSERYRLMGVITYHGSTRLLVRPKNNAKRPLGHYVAYCRRATGLWNEFDGTNARVNVIRNVSRINIQPSLLAYIKESFE
ncbi:unnamed protein product [Bemisia tabaci]|uniref:USP domain-containing protein n=1 Tax=Bemisia tabaci TaxID=7038 RepID=A0A9P0AL21_BEMTA|nr:unnamed protein product [Bemisia tabaci]